MAPMLAAAALVVIPTLAGCGNEAAQTQRGKSKTPQPASANSSPSPSRTQQTRTPEILPPTGPATASGRDAVAGPQRVFTGEELKKAILPDSAFGRHLTGGDGFAMAFESTPEQRKGRWQYCILGDENPAWLGTATYRGTEAAAHTQRVIGNEGEAVAVQWLASLPVASARDYMRLEQDIRRHCRSFSSDMEAGTAGEEYSVEPLEGLGDEAYLEIHEISYEGDVRTEYTAHVRIGGVLVAVTGVAGMADRDDTVRWTAHLAREVGSTLYGTGQG
ncbi:hypothetical protein [Streptomyces sp. BA2]|uniref:hypothetical protein n=1 Tax=Streptomyces sp. BA2 TaxID=436595 RepID=UPI0013210015|nr:hypothetical protein [Streptomyces sp. BA2]MWA15695.1 hypothetical protein [Streptomyces sp. BA2]